MKARVLTEKMQLPVINFYNRRGCISLGVNHSVPFGTRHFFGIPRRYPKFPLEILAAARAKPPRKGIRAKNAIAFFGLIPYPPKAFTFIEILIVILIISSLAVLAAPQFRNTFNTLEFNGFVKDIYYLTQYLRESAISKGAIYCLNIETDKEQLQVYATWRDKEGSQELWQRLQGRFARTYKAPQGVAIFSITPADKKNIYFYPDGSADSIIIVFENKLKQQVSLVIKGASGAIQIK